MNNLRFFVDFDGTVTTVDVIDAVLERFADPAWRRIEKEWADGRIGSRECLSKQIALVRASREDLEELLSGIEVDPHFFSFVKDARQAGVPVTIVSDGLDLLIETILSRAAADRGLLETLPVFSNHLRWTLAGPEIFFDTPVVCAHGCANCKPAVMRREARPADRTVFVGDGLSDRFAAEAADLTFAKGKLLDYCLKKGLRHEPYGSFRDVREWLKRHCERSEAISAAKIASSPRSSQ